MRNSNGGFILYAVLGITAFVALGLVSASLVMRGGTGTVALNNLELSRDALMVSGIETAAYQLLVLGMSEAAVSNQEIRFDEGVVRITVSSATGRVDLNGSDIPLLEAAYAASGATRMTAKEFAARVNDWRDEGDERREAGAEAEDYATAGLTARPTNRSFNSVDEVQWLLGIGHGDLEKLSPYLTVYNPGGQLDPTMAAPALIAAIPGLDASKLTALKSMPSEDQTMPAELAEVARLFSKDGPMAFSIDVEVSTLASGRPRQSRVTVIASPTGDRAFEIVGLD